jgi:hypothetical protein
MHTSTSLERSVRLIASQEPESYSSQDLCNKRERVSGPRWLDIGAKSSVRCH